MTDDLQPLTPEEGVERFLRHREPSVAESTMYNAEHRLDDFLEWCADRDVTNLNDLTGRDLADFVAWRRGQVAPITLQKQLSTIRVALRWWASIEAVPEGLAEKVHAPELPDGAESRDDHLRVGRAETVLAYYEQHHYASRDHALLALLWRTGMRRSAVRALDVDDLEPDEHAVRVENRPGTGLKNDDDGSRWVWLGPKWFQVLADYRDNPDRPDVTDEYGRRPLFSTENGRPTGSTIYNWVMRAMHPCNYATCPHDREPETCEARGTDASLAECPSSVNPHAIRRGAITRHLNEGIAPETVSERMDVSLEVLYRHYDARTDREKMQVRRDDLESA